MDGTPAFLDANVFGYAWLDNGEIGEKARERLNTVAEGKLEAACSPLVLDEVLWVIWKSEDKQTAIRAVEKILADLPLSHLDLPGRLMELALSLITRYNLKPRDALHAATMHYHGLKRLISNDADFDRVPWLERVEI